MSNIRQLAGDEIDFVQRRRSVDPVEEGSVGNDGDPPA